MIATGYVHYQGQEWTYLCTVCDQPIRSNFAPESNRRILCYFCNEWCARVKNLAKKWGTTTRKARR